MGEDKALLPVDGIPMLRRVYAASRQVLGPEGTIFVVTPWPDRYRPLLFEPECRWVEEPACETPPGPLSGFILGLEPVETEWVLVLACDLPRLDTGVLQAALHSLPQISTSVLAVLPRSDQQSRPWEPLAGFYRTASLDSARQFYAAGGRSFQGWLAGIAVSELPAPPSMLLNCNTPADLERANDASP